MERAQVRSIFLTHTKRTSRENSAQNCALFLIFCLLLERTYDTIIVSKTSVNRWNQGIFHSVELRTAAAAAERNDTSCGGSGPRGPGFESRHSDHIETQALIRCLRFLSFCQKPFGARLFDTFANEILFIVSKLTTQKSKLSDFNLPVLK